MPRLLGLTGVRSRGTFDLFACLFAWCLQSVVNLLVGAPGQHDQLLGPQIGQFDELGDFVRKEDVFAREVND